MTTIVVLGATTATAADHATDAPNALAHPIELRCVAGMEIQACGLEGMTLESAHDPAARGAPLQALAVGAMMVACVARRS